MLWVVGDTGRVEGLSSFHYLLFIKFLVFFCEVVPLRATGCKCRWPRSHRASVPIREPHHRRPAPHPLEDGAQQQPPALPPKRARRRGRGHSGQARRLGPAHQQVARPRVLEAGELVARRRQMRAEGGRRRRSGSRSTSRRRTAAQRRAVLAGSAAAAAAPTGRQLLVQNNVVQPVGNAEHGDGGCCCCAGSSGSWRARVKKKKGRVKRQ